MKFFPDTSFLCALYREQDNSAEAREFYQSLDERLGISAAVMFEFRQSVRLQVFLNSKDSTKGYRLAESVRMLAKLEQNLACGAIAMIPGDWPAVWLRAERVSAASTIPGGHRSWDVLHVATALHLGAHTLLSFDLRQRSLAALNHLKVAPRRLA